MTDITEGRARRNAKLAALPLGMAGRAAAGLGKRMVGRDKDEINQEMMEKAAEQLFSVLGELKGGAMKVGQALSVMEAAVPEQFGEPFREALTKLQAQAPPMSVDRVHRTLDQQLGTSWRTHFREFADVPAAAASVGQVHRGVWSDGRVVAVKIQYPGADVALRADLKTLSRMGPLLQRMSPGTDVRALMDELIDRTEDELDYLGEADNQRAFAAEFAGDPHFRIPRIYASAPKVIVSEWVSGTPMSEIIRSGTQEQRNLAAERLATFEVSSPVRVGLLHGDPHPGNFHMLDDGRLVVFDFGAIGHYPDGLPPEIGPILRLARDRDYPALRAEMVKTGFIQASYADKVGAADLEAYLKPYVDPLYTESFHFTRKWLQRAAGYATDLRGDVYKTSRHLNVPSEYVMILRVLLGSVGIASQLGAEAPYRRIMEQWVPGLAD